MRLWDRWRSIQASYRREMDERAQVQLQRASRDALVALGALFLLGRILISFALPDETQQAAFTSLPVLALAIAAVVFYVSAGGRRAFTRRSAIIFASVYLTAALLAVVAFVVAGIGAVDVLGLVMGIILTAVLMVAVAWRNV